MTHHLVHLKLNDIKMLANSRQPPGSWLLDEMGVTAIREYLHGGPHMNREEGHLSRDAGQLGDDVVDQFRFDVFQHIDAADQIGRLRRAVFGEGRVVRFVDRVDPCLIEPDQQVLFARAIVGYALRAGLLDQIRDQRRKLQRRDPIVGVLMQLLLQLAVFLGDGLVVLAHGVILPAC